MSNAKRSFRNSFSVFVFNTGAGRVIYYSQFFNSKQTLPLPPQRAYHKERAPLAARLGFRLFLKSLREYFNWHHNYFSVYKYITQSPGEINYLVLKYTKLIFAGRL